MKEELSVIQASRTLGITLDAIYRLIYAGKLAARKSEGKWLISASGIESRLEARKVRNGA